MRTNWLRDKRLDCRILMILAISLVMSCEEYQEGCMDASATNFKVSNQMPCCCEYPELVFQTTLTDGENTLSFTDTFTNETGQRYLVRELRFMASEIALTDSIDRVYESTDTFDNYLVPPTLLATNVTDLNSTGANFLMDGTFDRLDFSIDQVGALQGKVPEDFPSEHPLRDSAFYDFSSQSWIWARAVIEWPDSGVVALDLPASDLPIPVHIPGSWTKTRGRDMIVNFRINIGTLFYGMDFSLPESTLLDEFKANLRSSFEP